MKFAHHDLYRSVETFPESILDPLYRLLYPIFSKLHLQIKFKKIEKVTCKCDCFNNLLKSLIPKI